MKTQDKMFTWLIALLVVSLLGCGTTEGDRNKDDNGDDENPSLLTAENSLAMASDSFSEAFDLLDEISISPDSVDLNLLQEVSHERTCEQDGDDALVKINSSLLIDRNFSGIRADWEMHLEGSNATVRRWSMDGVAIECNNGGKYPKLSDDITNLHLDATFERKLNGSTKRTVRRTGVSKERTVSYYVKGQRLLDGLSQENLEEENSIVRNWRVVSNVDRCFGAKNILVNILTDDQNPLNIAVTRDADDFHLIEKKIVSGSFTASKAQGGNCGENTTEGIADDQSVKIEYENLVVQYDANKNCEIKSGKMIAGFYVNDTLKKQIEVSVDDEGEVSAIDGNTGESFDDFELPLCVASMD
ncbi:MAG: hypothetical protein R3B45_05025 [Bdellovibrionota bacterium]